MSEGLYAREKGAGGVPIVLLHGFGGHHGDWTDIQPDLARDRLVLAYDLPGHGRSRDVAGAGPPGRAAEANPPALPTPRLKRAIVGGPLAGTCPVTGR